MLYVVVGRLGREDGELAQLGERLVCIQEVTGSSPVFSTNAGSITSFDLNGIARGLRGSVGVWQGPRTLALDL